MKMKSLFILLIGIGLFSCDPVHTLSVYNASDKARRMEIVGIQRDSVPVQDLIGNGKFGNAKLIPVASKNENKNSFSIILKPKQKANLEFGFGTRPVTEKIIIDSQDTVYVKKNEGRIKKRPLLAIGGNYLLTLDQ